MRVLSPSSVSLSSGVLLLLAAGLAFAAPPAKKKDAEGSAAPRVDVEGLAAKVKSGDPEAMQSAFDELRIAGPSGRLAGPAVVTALSNGLTLPLTVAAIETLGDLEAETGSDTIAAYVTHRDVKIRRAAVKALARTRGKDAGAALRRALSDPDAVVRGTAASGLGALKAKDAVPDLFVALDHRINEAAASIGQLCNPDQCEHLATRLGALPFDVVTSGLEPVLFRPTSEVSDDAKVKLVNRIRDLKTAEAHKFLRDVQARWPKTGSPKVKQAIDQAVSGTVNASGVAGGEK